MKTRLTPQRKKELSLSRDRRNAYGQNDKASRTCLRRKRAMKNRTYRHTVRQAIASAIDVPEVIEDAASVIRRKEWRKWPDIPLGELIELKRERRLRIENTNRLRGKL